MGAIEDAAAALDLLRLRWAAAIGRSSLLLTAPPAAAGDVGCVGDRLYVGTDPQMLIPDRLANAAVDLLRTLNACQLKTCPVEDGGCGWLFLDRSHNSTRRWCSMQDCGARAKARRLTAQRRANRAQR